MLGRFPTEDDELAIAAIVDSLPPADYSEDCLPESAFGSVGSDTPGPESESEESTLLSDDASSSARAAIPETQESASEPSAAPAFAPASSSNDSATDATPAQPLDIFVSPPDDISSHPHLPVGKDLPELIHSLPTSSNSSEYGDELEDPPYPSALAVAVPLAHGTKHLPLASRTVHLSLCYSLTWWLSKHPMF